MAAEAKREGLNRNEVNDPDACIKAYKWNRNINNQKEGWENAANFHGSPTKYIPHLCHHRDWLQAPRRSLVQHLSFSAELSRLIMKIALPASIFTSVIRQLDASKLASFGGGLVLGGAAILLSYAAGFLLCRLFKVRHGRQGTFINTFANANTIFIGMPLNLALFGPQGESAFLAYYVLNTLSTWAFGSFLITGDPTEAGSLQERNPKSTLKQVYLRHYWRFLQPFCSSRECWDTCCGADDHPVSGQS